MHTPDIVRLELDKGAEMWKKALALVDDGYALIEFVKDDSDEALAADAAVLNRWTKEQNK